MPQSRAAVDRAIRDTTCLQVVVQSTFALSREAQLESSRAELVLAVHQTMYP